ncbi:MAG: glycosyltransferase family 2 protein [Bryobacteraceae bacterium]
MKHSGAERPDVSVIIPAYRVAAYIADALDSVLAQGSERADVTAVEIIVVNDGSPDTDALEKALEPYRDRIVYLKQENGGVSSARNAGIGAARGEWLAFLDGDDMWVPDYLESQFAVLRADPRIDMAFGSAILFGDTPLAGRCTTDISPIEGEITFLKAVAGECTIAYCAVVRREIVIRAGMFDTRLRGSEDFNLWLRVLKAGGRIVYQHKPLYRYRRREGSATSDSVWMNERILESLQRAEETIPMSGEEHASLERHQHRVRTELALARGKAAFGNRDWRGAIGHYLEAHELMPNGKVQAILFLLKLCPRLTYAAYNWRQKRALERAVRV